jgi:hypothetical protein
MISAVPDAGTMLALLVKVSVDRSIAIAQTPVTTIFNYHLASSNIVQARDYYVVCH